MVPTGEGNDNEEGISIDDGINDFKQIFGNNFDATNLDFNKIKKHKERFLNLITKWSKNHKREEKELYFRTFSVTKWIELNDDIKGKHNTSCTECETSFLEVHTMFPSNQKLYCTEKQRFATLLEKSKNGNFKEVCEKLKNGMKRLLDESFSSIKKDHGNAKKITKGRFKSLSKLSRTSK